jgi:putative transposase
MGSGTRGSGTHDGWKQAMALGTRHNQTVVTVPPARFVQLLTYRAALVGRRVVLTAERSTSQAHFVAGDRLPVEAPGQTEPPFSGRRVKRGLYRAADGTPSNADVNGAYTILRTAAPPGVRAREERGRRSPAAACRINCP